MPGTALTGLKAKIRGFYRDPAPGLKALRETFERVSRNVPKGIPKSAVYAHWKYGLLDNVENPADYFRDLVQQSSFGHPAPNPTDDRLKNVKPESRTIGSRDDDVFNFGDSSGGYANLGSEMPDAWATGIGRPL